MKLDSSIKKKTFQSFTEICTFFSNCLKDKNDLDLLKYSLFVLRNSLISKSKPSQEEIVQNCSIFYDIIDLIEKYLLTLEKQILFECIWIMLNFFYIVNDKKLNETLFQYKIIKLFETLIYKEYSVGMQEITIWMFTNSLDNSPDNRDAFLGSKVFEWCREYIKRPNINIAIVGQIIWCYADMLKIKPEMEYSKVFRY